MLSLQRILLINTMDIIFRFKIRKGYPGEYERFSVNETVLIPQQSWGDSQMPEAINEVPECFPVV